jgi:predicted nucleotidyltransferase
VARDSAREAGDIDLIVIGDSMFSFKQRMCSCGASVIPVGEAVVLFGSEARGEARESSDIDLLIVVAGFLDLKRDLYRR